MAKDQRKKSKVKVYTNKQKSTKPETEYIQELQAKYNEKVDLSKIKSFKDFPLSSKTLKGLKDAGYKVPTEIQKEAIMLALKGEDILGAAQTGSGKTLAFLIPMLEKLFCKQWTHLDGLGALVITPTRELALQIFETLKKIGVYHDFSCGLIIGGKDLKFERKRMDQCNIIICTPGRLLHHMDENPLFDAVNLQVLVLDEADRCLDMGFKNEMNAIIENLPLERQTFLFSATQTKSVKDLARLNLKNPSYVAVHENAAHSTPDALEQRYIVCDLQDKVTVLWSFIKNHLKKKCIVFLSTGKQVKFIFEVFSKMRPGVPLMALYGRLHQLKRMKIYEEFSRKTAAVLFATDIAARGLDFPEVHWVVQVDCPDDAETYIHRVGRTARYCKGGESLLLLMPSELKMLEELEKKKIPISKIEINPNKMNDPFRKMETFVSGDTALQYTAKRACVTYLKSILLKSRKDIFNLDTLDCDAFAHSYGLAVTPTLRFLKGKKVKKEAEPKAGPKADPHIEGNAYCGKKTVFDSDGESKVEQKDSEESHGVKNTVFGSDSDSEEEENAHVKPAGGDGSEFDRGDLWRAQLLEPNVRKVEVPEVILKELEVVAPTKKPTTKAALVKKMLNTKSVTNKKTKFDEEGNPVGDGGQQEWNTRYGLDLEKLQDAFREVDKEDKSKHREKVKAKHKEQRRKLKEQKKKEAEEKVDDFGESESDEDVDLSWLPDPEKVYGGNGVEEEDNEDEDSSSERMTLKAKKKKRKLEESGEGPKKKKHKKHNEITSDSTMSEGEDTDSEPSKKNKENKEMNKIQMTHDSTSNEAEDTDEEVPKKKKHKKQNKIKETSNEDEESTDETLKKKKHKKLNKIKEITSDLTVNETEQLALMLLQK